MPTSGIKNDKVRVFFSYAREDAETRNSLEKYIDHLKRAGRISTWSDKEILPGQPWDQTIRQQLAECDLILLLISIDFLNSRYIWDVELTIALERCQRGELEILPIVVRRLPEGSNPFSGLQAIPTDAKPIDDWENKEHALVDVSDGIARLIDAYVAKRNKAADSKPYPGPLSDSIFCDRDEQEFEFLTTCRQLLRDRPGIPQVYIIRGEPWRMCGSGSACVTCGIVVERWIY